MGHLEAVGREALAYVRSRKTSSDYTRMARQRCFQRDMTPDDLVGTLLYLVGPGAAFVTGQTLYVNGGALTAEAPQADPSHRPEKLYAGFMNDQYEVDQHWAIRLREEIQYCSMEIAAELGQSMANTSHHLRALAGVGLVRTRREGNRIFYGLASERVASLWAALRDVAREHEALRAAEVLGPHERRTVAVDEEVTPRALSPSATNRIWQPQVLNSLFFSRSLIPFPRNNSKPVVHYKHIGVYAFRRNTLLEFTSWPVTPLEAAEKIECLRYLENGVPLKMVVTEYMGVEIDTPEDLERAAKLL